MKKKWCFPLIGLFLAGSLFTCIDSYLPKLETFQSTIVVDALLTDENASNYVSISRTKRTVYENPVMVSGALVIITDDLGNSTSLLEKSEGIYNTDSIIFRGIAGRSYTL